MLLAGVAVAFPAVLLLLQKWAAARMGAGVYDAELNGQPISINAVIGWSIGLSLPLVLASVAILSIAVRNRRKNNRDVTDSPTAGM